MNEEEFFNRAINRICKDYDYSFANEFRLLFLKQEKEINHLQSKIDKANEYVENNLEVDEHDDYIVYLGKNENELLDILKEDK